MSAVVLFVEIDTVAGQRDAFLARVREHRANVQKNEPGCQCFDIAVPDDGDDPGGDPGGDKVRLYEVYADQDSMLEAVMGIAKEIASKPPLAIYGCKRMITYARDHNTADGLDYIGVWNASMLQPSEMLEAITSRAEKRAPDYVDLPPIKRSVAGD